MTEKPELHFEFPSEILFDPDVADGYMKHYLPVPDGVALTLEEAGFQHVEGRLDEHPFRRALHLRPDGSRCLKFGMTWLRQMGLDVGDEVHVVLEPDHDPDRVDVPPELEALLAEEPEVEEVWSELSPSKRKTLVYHVERAKQAATRERRAQAIVDDLRKRIWRGPE